MPYIGLQEQRRKNNARSLLLLILFPALVAALVWVGAAAFGWLAMQGSYNAVYAPWWYANTIFVEAIPWVMGGVALWFVVAWFVHTWMIRRATGARPLERKENTRVYNLVENLCMAEGMPMPRVNVIEEGSLNAFASGVHAGSYTVTLTRGIIDTLDDDELGGVIAHELSHIRNRDVRLLIVSIVFVGIFTVIGQIALRVALSSRGRSRGKNSGGVVVLLLILAALAGIGYFFATVMRFAISRKREYLADAAAAQMTRNPAALASALRKISARPEVDTVRRSDVAQLFIQHPLRGGKKWRIFTSHPPIERRIEILEQF